MINALEEAIKYYSELAEENEKDAEQFKRIKATQDIISHCYECAKDHRQLADWLKELKALLENEDVMDVFKDCKTCKYKELGYDDFPCDRCCHNYINEYV